MQIQDENKKYAFFRRSYFIYYKKCNHQIFRIAVAIDVNFKNTIKKILGLPSLMWP